MASMRKLNRRLLRWHRYAHHTYWNPRISRPAWMGPNTAMSQGHIDAWNARELEQEHRQCFRFYPTVGMPCMDCGLPDLHRGQGDGIGSCDCPRCSDCGAAPGDCDGHDDLCESCEDPACLGDCWGEEDDSQPWPPGVVTEHAFSDRGLL